MASLWLSFFRENCASFVALFVLLPLSLFINARLAALLIGLVALFGVSTSFVLRRTEGMQGRVEGFNTDLAERASDALGNVPVIQSFTQHRSRIAGAARDHRRAARGADAGPVLVGGRGGRDPRFGDAHAALDLPARHRALSARPRHDRRDRHVHEFRDHADRQARSGRGLRQFGCSWRCRSCSCSSMCSTPSRACATGRGRATPAGSTGA